MTHPYKLATICGILLSFMSMVTWAEVICAITPQTSFVVDGQDVQVTAKCDQEVTAVDWLLNDESISNGFSAISPAAANSELKLQTPITLAGAANGEYTVRLSVKDRDSAITSTAATAKIYVKPSYALASTAASNETLSTVIDGSCASTYQAKAISSLPSDSLLCTTGKAGLIISSPDGFSWTCMSPNGGLSPACYALRGYTVTATVKNNTGGTISPGSQPVKAGDPAQVVATPTGNMSVKGFTSDCGSVGTRDGNSYSIAAVNSTCNIEVEFTDTPINGECGNATTQLVKNYSDLTSLCAKGSPVEGSHTTQQFKWSCTNTGQSANCFTTRGYGVTPAITGGTITPSAEVIVAYNGNQVFNIQPTVSGHVAGLGAGNTCGGSVSGNQYNTSAVTGACSAAIAYTAPVVNTADPGRNTGLWVPPTLANGSPNNNVLVVVDQMNKNGAGSVTVVPGCVNQRIDSTTCRNANSVSDPLSTGGSYTVSLAPGKIVSVRMDSTSTAGTTPKVMYVNSTIGGGLPFAVSASISTVPGDFNVVAKCKSSSTTGGTISVNTGTFTSWLGLVENCPLTPNRRYYLNVKADQACSNGCGVAITEPGDLY